MMDFFKVIRTRVDGALRVLTADLRGVGAEGDDDNAEPVEEAEVFQPWGLIARPLITATLEALAARADEILPLFLIDKGAAAFTPTVEEGETRLYNGAGATVRLRASGIAELNGGALNVARVTDPVAKNAQFSAWLVAVETALNTVAPGSVPPLSLSTTFTNVGTVTGGNPTIKA